MTHISKDELGELQHINLQMARYFVNFCKEHDLLCYFCGGGCIGAIRHKGFIPWDDDLDFFMPREDYEKLFFLWKKYADTEKYSILKPTKDFVDHNLFTTIRDNQTTMIKPYQANIDMPHGVAMDVFPLDGYPQSKGARRKQCFWALVYSLFCAQLVPINHGKCMTSLGKLGLVLFQGKTVRYNIWKTAEREMSKYKINNCNGITELCAGPGYMKNWYPKEVFASAVYIPFEDTQMPIPIGYDKYLKIAFGNYMKFPPQEKQVASHDAVKLDLKQEYQKYKGIYYCTKSNMR